MSTWHSYPITQDHSVCVHCYERQSGGHYACTEDNPCQDCTDDSLTASENIAAGYGPHGEDTGSDSEYDHYTYDFPMGEY